MLTLEAASTGPSVESLQSLRWGFIRPRLCGRAREITHHSCGCGHVHPSHVLASNKGRMRHVSGSVEPHDISMGLNTLIYANTRISGLPSNTYVTSPVRVNPVLGGLCFTHTHFLVLGSQSKWLPSAPKPFIWNWEAAAAIKAFKKNCLAKTRSSGFCCTGSN